MQKNDIERSVARHVSLSLNARNPREYGVNKSGVRGSLWISTYEGKQYEGTRVQTTGEVAKILNTQVEGLASSKYIGEHHGYKYWYIENVKDIENLIDAFGRH